MGEEGIAFRRGNAGKDLVLKLEGDRLRGVEAAAAGRDESETPGPTVVGVGFPAKESGLTHPFDEGGDGVRVGGHAPGQIGLGDSGTPGLGEVAQDRELVGSDVEVGDPAAEGLIEPVPGPAQEEGKPALVRGEACVGQRAGG